MSCVIWYTITILGNFKIFKTECYLIGVNGKKDWNILWLKFEYVKKKLTDVKFYME